MAKQVRVNTATGQVTGSRIHPAPAHEPAVWYDEQRDAVPAFDPDTQAVEQDNKLVGDKYVYGHTVRSLTAQELADKVPPTNEEIYDQVMQNQAVFKAFALCINDGTIVPGSNISNAALKTAVKAKM